MTEGRAHAARAAPRARALGAALTAAAVWLAGAGVARAQADDAPAPVTGEPAPVAEPAPTPAPEPPTTTPEAAARLARTRTYAVRQARWQLDTALRRGRGALMATWQDPPRPDPSTLDGPLRARLYQRPDGTYPMWTDNADRLSMTVLALDTMSLWGRGAYPGRTRLDTRLRALHFALPLSRDYRDHDAMPSLTFRGLEITTPELGADWLSLWQAAGLGARWDGRWAGLELGAFVLSVPDARATSDDGLRLGTPFVGLRGGELDRGPRASIHVQFPALFVYGWGDEARSLRDHVVAFVRAEVPTASPYVRLQARGQLRDLDRRDAQGGRVVLRDALLVVGPEVAAEFGLRAFPVFVGLGARRVEAAGEVRRLGSGRVEQDLYEPEGETHFVVLVSADLGMYGATTVW